MPDQTIDPRAEYTSRIEARLSEAASQFSTLSARRCFQTDLRSSLSGARSVRL
jgi:hypothetical protein